MYVRMRTLLKTVVSHFQLVQKDFLGLTATRCATARTLRAATTSWERAAASPAGWERPASSVRTAPTAAPGSLARVSAGNGG